MKTEYDVAIVGAGPAGLAAAKTASDYGLSVAVFDEQNRLGGLIYHSIEASPLSNSAILGEDYHKGRILTEYFRNSNVDYVEKATVWHLSPALKIGYSRYGQTKFIHAKYIILATGALERPFPIKGWQLPGVMSAGAAQIMLKSSGIVCRDAVFAGTGPLLLSIICQYIEAGIPVRAFVDTNQYTNFLKASVQIPTALMASRYLTKGLNMLRKINKSGIPIISGVKDLKAHGQDSLTSVEYLRGKISTNVQTENLFLHQGVVPNVNLSQSIGCQHYWDNVQLCWRPETDIWGKTTIENIAIAGDGVDIGGAVAAEQRGRIAAIEAAYCLKRIEKGERDKEAKFPRRVLRSEKYIRPFLDALYRPRKHNRIPLDDDVVVCRCEEVTVGDVRKAVAIGARGPQQVKSFTRSGMGPCQGRQCAITISELIAEELKKQPSEAGCMRIRTPIKPVTLGEIASVTETANLSNPVKNF